MIRALLLRSLVIAITVAMGGELAAVPLEEMTLADAEAAEGVARAKFEKEKSLESQWEWIDLLALVGHRRVEAKRDEEAVAPYREAVEHLPETVSPGDREFVASLHDSLGRALENSGAFAEAEKYLERGLALRRAIEGPRARRQVGVSEGHLGMLRLKQGRYAEAAKLLHDALAKTPPEEDALMAHRHDCLGRYFLALRAPQRAAEEYEKAVRFAEAGAEPGDDLLGDLRNNLAWCRYRLGDREGARDVIDEGLALPPGAGMGEWIRYAGLLNFRGTIHAEEGRLTEAQADVEKALELVEAARGKDHPALAPFLVNLASVRLQAGDPAEGLPPLQRAKALLRPRVDNSHQAMVELLHLVAACRLALGGGEEARGAVLEARAASGKLMTHLLANGSERELLTFREKVDLHSVLCQLGDAGLIADSLLSGKGRIMEAVLERRAGGEKHGGELSTLRAKLDQLLLADQAPDAERIARIREKVRALTGERSSFVGSGALRWQEVRASLPSGAAYIDYVRYFSGVGAKRVARYGAVVIASGGEPKWVPLAEERALTRSLNALHESISLRAHIVVTGKGKPGTPMFPRLQSLYTAFWDPVKAVLPRGTKRVVVCPEGRLHLAPFAVLLNPAGGFLCEELSSFRFVDSGRAVLRSNQAKQVEAGGWLVMGVSDFSRHLKALREGEHSWSAPLATEIGKVGKLKTIPEELRSLQGLAPPGSTVLLNEEANESVLRDMSKPPAVLHLASHGFLVSLGGGRDFDADPSALYENGILLGVSGGEGDDGILFPEEIAALDLRGTDLVTLSTCRSALGRPVSGEGVLGLRRGIAKAGARHILASLWVIPDRSTTAFMKRYYEGIAKGTEPGAMLWHMQAERFGGLRGGDLRGEKLENAILEIGGFVLTSPGG